MRASAHQIEVFDYIIAVMAAQIGALPQDRLKAKRAAQMGVEIACKILGRIAELGHDTVVDIGDEAAANLVENAFLQHRCNLVPIHRQLAHMGNRNQRVECALARRCHRRIGYGWVVQIDREILRQHAVVVNVFQQALVARAEQDRVVRNAGPCALQPEMDDEKPGAKALARKRFGIILAPLRAGQKIAVGMHDVSIGSDRIKARLEPAFGFDLARARTMRVHLHHRIADAHCAAQPLEMAHHACDQAVCAASGPPHAAIFLKLVDERIDRRCFHRIAADQQRVERERLAQFLALHIA